jgi:outer membrane protein
VLISQQVLFQAQRDYALSRHNYLLNSLRLKQAAGTITLADLQAVNAVLQ